MYSEFAAEYDELLLKNKKRKKETLKKYDSKAEYVTEKMIVNNATNEELIMHATDLDWLYLSHVRRFTLNEIELVKDYFYFDNLISSKLYSIEEILYINNKNIYQLIHMTNPFNLIIYYNDDITSNFIMTFKYFIDFSNSTIYKRRLLSENNICSLITQGFANKLDWSAIYYYMEDLLSDDFKIKYMYRIKDNKFLMDKLIGA